MKKIHYFIFITLFINIFIKGQISITYAFNEFGMKFNSQLIINKKESLYTEYRERVKKGTEDLDEKGNLIGEVERIETYYLKKHKRNEIFYSSPISYNKKSIIREEIGLKWKIDSTSTKNIIGYKTYKATCVYRGRNYIAYFCPVLNYSDGPKIFCGLPGAILELNEETGKLNIVAQSINLKKVKIKLTNFDVNEAISWDSAVEIAKIKYRSLQQEMLDKYNSATKVDFSNSLEVYDLNK